MRRLALISSWILLLSCQGAPSDGTPTDASPGGKADDFADERSWEVLLTDPHCDVCTSSDKTHLLERSPIIARVLQLIDGAQSRIDIAQFTWSNRDIEAAVVAAAQRGVQVRIAMDAKQAQGDTVARRLAEAGLDVRFIEGRDAGSFTGLQHAKFMRVDDSTLLMGSNNWSSTGTSINEENTLVLTSASDDPLLSAFDCYFEAMFDARIDDGPQCSTDEVRFSPSSAGSNMLRDEFRAAQSSIDVLMHHLVFDKTIKELIEAAQGGVRVRVLANAEDRDEYTGSLWEQFTAAGGELRFKQTNPDLFQIMHHKLAVVDGQVLLHGSGNWSGSAFFNNYEFYLRNRDTQVVMPFVGLFERLWSWSLTGDALDRGLSAAQQDTELTQVFFGNLHAHYEATDGDRLLDDGELMRDVDGELVDVSGELAGRHAAQYAFEYARDQGGLDFLALSPHVVDERADDPADVPNMTAAGYEQLVRVAQDVNEASAGSFVALPSMEWSTNSTGNHVGILGTQTLCKAQRGAFDELFDDFLPDRVAQGDHPLVMFNHPRTFSHHEGVLEGSWDQIFGINLADIPRAGDRNKKFNDFGLDDYEPLRSVREDWIAGNGQPDEQVVAQTLANIEAAARPYARLMEVTVGRGTELGSETPQNPSLSLNEDGELERFTKVHSDWDYYLLHGFELAPVANHDNHLANWGTGHTSRTAVIAPTLDEAGLLRAIERRSVFASEDENLEVRLYAEGRARAGTHLRTLADDVTLDLLLTDPDFDGPFEVTVFLGTIGGAAVDAVATLQIDGGVDDPVDGGSWHHQDVPLPGPGRHFVYVQVHEAEPNRMAWSAPVWITQLEP